MSRRKPVTAWAVVWDDALSSVTLHATRQEAEAKIEDHHGAGGCGEQHIVKLVEADPLRDAVVRAAVQLVKDRFETDGDDLVDAVERLQKRGKR